MNYREALDYLDSRIVFGIRPGLERISALSARLGSPETGCPVIQITGSNGKTSVAWMVSSILKEHGIKVGTHTSPHLHSYTERIVIDGEPVSRDLLATELGRVAEEVTLVDEAETEPVTHFEILTALAYRIFHAAGVGVAVVEVGMGGRWDATSIARPEIAVVTTVALEHTDRLGATIREIAAEKSHIIKEGSRAVLGRLPAEALRICQDRAACVGADVAVLGTDYTARAQENGLVEVDGGYGRRYRLALPIFSSHQVDNLAVAVAAAESFVGGPLDRLATEKAIRDLSFPGRLEVVGAAPTVILDGAHNPAGAAALARALEGRFSWDRLIMVVAIFDDKEVGAFLSRLARLAPQMIVSENASERRAPADKVVRELEAIGRDAAVEPDLKKAVDRAIGQAGPRDLVLITGSLYTVAEARGHLLGSNGPLPPDRATEKEKGGGARNSFK